VWQRVQHVQLDALLALDMVRLAELGLDSVLADNPDLLRHTFRRGELYNAASSTRGVQCQQLAPKSGSASISLTSRQLHWTHGPDIYRHLRSVCIPDFPTMKARGGVHLFPNHIDKSVSRCNNVRRTMCGVVRMGGGRSTGPHPKVEVFFGIAMFYVRFSGTNRTFEFLLNV